jgi:hypothetical protein
MNLYDFVMSNSVLDFLTHFREYTHALLLFLTLRILPR